MLDQVRTSIGIGATRCVRTSYRPGIRPEPCSQVGRFTPQEDDQGRFYAFEGPGTISKIIAGLAPRTGIVTR